MPPVRARCHHAIAALGLVVIIAFVVAASPARGVADIPPPAACAERCGDWTWPVDEVRLERAFEAPAHRYGAGHRGIDLRVAPGADVRAPAAGVVAFSGDVAGRGVLTIDHGKGLVTTLEPVDSDLVAGDPVTGGDRVATLGLGGHAAPGTLHFGVRLDGEYINPMLLLGVLPRAVLLPCC